MSTEEEQAYAARWDDRWQKDVTPWDLGEPAPVLLSLFDKGELGDGTGKALVPGCGTGYEVTWIGSHKDWSATGLDLSPTANAVALKVC